MTAPNTIETASLLVPLIITLVAPFAIMLARGNANRREAVSFIAAALTFLSVLQLAPGVIGGTIYTYTVTTILPGISLTLCADGLGMIFALIATFLWGFATSYNIGYMRGLLYLFYEVITVFTYPLVAHHQDAEGFAGARKYLVYLMGTSKLFLLPAMILTYVLTGTLDMRLGDVLTGMFPADVIAAHPNLVRLTYVLYIAGLAKAALAPFHNWLPSAMVAPTPVSALLHAVAVVKAGVFSVSRIILSGFGVEAMDTLGLGLPTAWLAAFTIVGASLIALTKDDIKARLAYSTVSQLSYVIIGVALLTPSAVQGGLMHIPHHAFSKITLFFGAGAIYVATHIKKISQMNGLGRRMPWTFGAFGLASLSMIGMPPVCGFVSKWYIVNGSLQAGQTALLVALLLSTLLNAGYFVPIFYRAFMLPPAPDANIEQYSEAPASMVVPLCLTGAISLLLGLYPQVFLNFIQAFGHF